MATEPTPTPAPAGAPPPPADGGTPPAPAGEPPAPAAPPVPAARARRAAAPTPPAPAAPADNGKGFMKRVRKSAEKIVLDLLGAKDMDEAKVLAAKLKGGAPAAPVAGAPPPAAPVGETKDAKTLRLENERLQRELETQTRKGAQRVKSLQNKASQAGLALRAVRAGISNTDYALWKLQDAVNSGTLQVPEGADEDAITDQFFAGLKTTDPHLFGAAPTPPAPPIVPAATAPAIAPAGAPPPAPTPPGVSPTPPPGVDDMDDSQFRAHLRRTHNLNIS